MYVVYKEIIIPGIGGVHPQGLNIGLGSYNGWNLAECKEDEIREYAEYDLIPVPKIVATGIIKLSGIVLEDDGNPNNENFVITSDDKAVIEQAKVFLDNLELKIMTRATIAAIKDPEDDLVDFKRLVELLVIFATTEWQNKSDEQKRNSKYRKIMDALSSKVYDTNGYISNDINDNVEKINKLIEEENIITNIVKESYLSSKKEV